MFNIVLNTFKEIIRNKFLSVIIIFALAFILFSISLGKLTIGDNNKIIIDFGLAMIEIFGVISVLFVGSQLLFKEIEGKTIFLILSKPIKRYEFILGKFLGFSLSIFVVFLLQSFLFFGVLFFKDIEISKLIIISDIFIFLKLEILLSVVFLFSTFMSTILTIIMSILVYFISHSFSVLLDLANKMHNELMLLILKILNICFPPMEALNLKDLIGSYNNFSNTYFLLNTVYGILYIIILLVLSIFIFNRKKFES